MYTQRNKYWPAYTWNIQTSHSSLKNKISNEFSISQEDFSEIYFNIFDKINASFYHLECLKENEEIGVTMGKELANIQIPGIEGMVGIAGATYEPIGYEYESFLVTVKSALDFIAILLATGFGRKENNIIEFTNGIQTSNAISTSLEGKIYALINSPQFALFIDEYRNLKNQKSKRNFAAHKGSLPTGTINIPINNPHASPLLSKALDPNSSDPHASLLRSQNLVEFCENHFYQTCDLLIGVLSLLTNTSLSPGQKGSVYQQRLKANKMGVS